jgi:integrase/recombinase XerC
MMDSKKDYIEQYIDYLRNVRNMGAATITAYSGDLVDFRDYCDNYDIKPEDSRREDVRQYIGDMSFESRDARSVNRTLSSLRGFFKYLIRFNYRKDNPSETVRNIKTAKKLPEFLWEDEMKEFASLHLNKNILWPARDEALIMMIYSAGLRISEALALKVSDFENDFQSARVVGKGDKERTVFFSDEGRAAFLAYLPEREAKIKKDKSVKEVFINMRGGALSAVGAWWIIGEYVRRGGSEKNVHPHSLRHSFATHLMNGGCDIRVVQELLGHESLSTTQIYTHTTIERLKDVYKNAHPHA